MLEITKIRLSRLFSLGSLPKAQALESKNPIAAAFEYAKVPGQEEKAFDLAYGVAAGDIKVDTLNQSEMDKVVLITNFCYPYLSMEKQAEHPGMLI